MINDLKPVATEWKALGIELEIPIGDLDAIGALFTGQGGKAQACLQKVVYHWLVNSTRPPTGKVLKEVLEAVGHRRQANELPKGLLLVGSECQIPSLLCKVKVTHSLPKSFLQNWFIFLQSHTISFLYVIYVESVHLLVHGEPE